MNLISRKQIGDFTLEQISKKHYRIIYTATVNHDIAMTGAAVTKDFDIDFTFVLKRIHLTHHSSTFKTLSTDEMIIIVSRPQVHDVDGMLETVYRKSDLTVPKVMISFEDLGDEGGMVFEPSTLRLSLNSTSGDTIQPIIYIKRLD